MVSVDVGLVIVTGKKNRLVLHKHSMGQNCWTHFTQLFPAVVNVIFEITQAVVCCVHSRLSAETFPYTENEQLLKPCSHSPICPFMCLPTNPQQWSAKAIFFAVN